MTDGIDRTAPTPVRRVIDSWFAAWATRDMDKARAIAPDVRVRLPSGDVLNGFDEFTAWYAARRQSEGPHFSFSVTDISTTHDLAVVLIALHSERDGTEQDWMQVAVYRVDGSRIAEMWAFEDEHGAEPLTNVD